MWVCPACRAGFDAARYCPHDGTALDALVLERELGRGLTGAVWRAREAGGRAVAIKILHREWAQHAEMRERFLREVRAARAIDHPCVVAPIASGEHEDGRPYLVMELVDGPSLDEVLALGPLLEVRAAQLGADLADALAAVHRAGVVHRDVKPGNIRVGADGRAHLLDFGVARRLDLDEPRLTQGGLTVGTPHYMAPEQCTGDAITGRADVYALGCVLYRMLAGEVPFDGAAVAVMLAHATRDPAPLGTRAAVSARMERLVERCLAKRAGDRPAAEEVAEELRALAAGEPARASGTRVRIGRAATVPADDLGLAATSAQPSAAGFDPDAISTARRPTVGLARRRRRRALHLFAWSTAFVFGLLVFNATPFGHAIAHSLGIHLHPQIPFLEGPQPAQAQVEPRPMPPPIDGERTYLVAADGGVALRLGAPARLRRAIDQELTIEAWDDAGVPIDTHDLVVTFAGPEGALVGFAAEPTHARGVYRVRTRFATAGEWVVRAFPPIGDAMVTFHLDVAP